MTAASKTPLYTIDLDHVRHGWRSLLIERAAAFLAGDNSAFIAGATLLINGGQYMG